MAKIEENTMIHISEGDKRFIKDRLPELLEYLERGDLDELMMQLDMAELRLGYDKDYEDGPNEFGRQIEKLIDRLYRQNT